MVSVGDIVEDRITGFKGTVIARTEWLNGCMRVQIQPRGLTKDGKPKEAQAFDENNIRVITPYKKPNMLSGGGPDRHEEKR